MIELYNIEALKDRDDYPLLKTIDSPIDFQVIYNLIKVCRKDKEIGRMLVVLDALGADYVINRGGNNYKWFKTTGENYTIAKSMLIKDPAPLFWSVLTNYLEDGIRSAKGIKPIKHKIKDIAVDVVMKMRQGIYLDPFKDDSLNQTQVVNKIVEDDYPQIKNLNSFLKTVIKYNKML